MSKAALRKELRLMDAEQLSTLLLNLYDASKEAKYYLDFYVNPDVDKYMDNARKAVVKEATRRQSHRLKVRYTKLREIIGTLASLDPGDEYVLELMTFAVERVLEEATGRYIPASTVNGSIRLMRETVAKADAAGLLGTFLPRLREAVDKMKKTVYYVDRGLLAGVTDALEQGMLDAASKL